MIQFQYNITFSFQRFMLGGVIMEAGETYLLSHYNKYFAIDTYYLLM